MGRDWALYGRRNSAAVAANMTDGLVEMDPLTLSVWILFRVLFGAGGGIALAVGAIGVVGILRGKTALAGAADMDEFVTWHWNDRDQATAVLRTRAQLLSVVIVSGVVGLSYGVFWRRYEAETLLAWCVALFVIAIWWWLEREFAWPGWLVPREARGTRGLSQARREARRRSRQGEEDENLDGE